MNSNKNVIGLISLIVILLVLIIIIGLYSNRSDSLSYQELIASDDDNYSDIVVVDSNYLILSSISDENIKSRLTMYNKKDEMIWSRSYFYHEYDTYLNEIDVYEDYYLGIGYCSDDEKTYGLIVKFDNSGNVLEEDIFTYYNNSYYTDILLDDDKVIVVGYSYDDNYKWVGIINIYDDELKIVENQYLDDICLNAIETSDNNYIVIGYTNTLEEKNGILIIIDSSLTIVDSTIYEEQSEFNDIEKIDGGYVVVGTIIEKDNSDAFIIKYDDDGNFVWSNILGGNDTDYYSKVITISNNNILVIGTIYSTDIEANSSGGSRGVIVEYDSGGNIIFNDYYGVDDSQYCFSNVVMYDDNEYYIIGTYNDSGLIVKFSDN